MPIFIIAEERRVAQITQSQALLTEALGMVGGVEVGNDGRIVKILELPAVRFQDEGHLLKAEALVKNWLKNKSTLMKQPPTYQTSPKTDDGWFYLILKSKSPKDKSALRDIISAYNSENEQKIKYYEENMYDDIKAGVARARKAKREVMQKEGRSYQGQGGYQSYGHGNGYQAES